jgi:hypothetical protein
MRRIARRVHHERGVYEPFSRDQQRCGRTSCTHFDDLPPRLEDIERTLWLYPPRYWLMLRLANGPPRLTILPSTKVRFEVMRRNV